MRKTIGILILLGFVLMACAAPAPSIVKETVPVPQTVIVPQTVVVQQPAAPQPTAVPQPTATLPPPNAEVDVLAVAANAAKEPNVFTATVKIITDTVVGPANVTIAMGATGLNNVPINVPVHATCVSDNAKNPGKPAWSLLKPTASKATLVFTNTKQTEFTPDIVGAYALTCNLGGGGEVGGVQIHAGTFLGNDAENCKTCHASKVKEWLDTGHASILSDNIDNKRTPNVGTHYTESCMSCHSVGYYAPPYGVGSNGFKDAEIKANWTPPTWAQINAAGKGGPSTFAAMPAGVKALANIQCEQCHGPAAEHVKNGAPMATSQDEGVCNVCHNGSSRHDKGEQLKSARHAIVGTPASTISGFGEQACERCHSGEGYVTFIADPTNPAAWSNKESRIVCATCHDPHSDANPFQLRVMGKPLGMPFEVKKDVGLSATCFNCHNGRSNADDYASGKSTGTPHYSSIAELLSDTGGITYGQTVPNSPHGQLVGAAPIANPAAATDPEAAKFLFSGATDAKGNIPGPCVVCHMWGGITDSKNPNYEKVGGHSFNTVSPDGKFDYGASCKSCHGDVTDFNLKAKADYDGNGKTEGVQDEVKGLLNVLWKALTDKGVKKIDTGYPYATLPQGADMKIKSAWYNFRVVYGVMWGTETGNGQEGKAN
ncbi:MAG TPA: cytochrome c3 family protein, partial [Anaerolineae bacterium]